MVLYAWHYNHNYVMYVWFVCMTCMFVYVCYVLCIYVAISAQAAPWSATDYRTRSVCHDEEFRVVRAFAVCRQAAAKTKAAAEAAVGRHT